MDDGTFGKGKLKSRLFADLEMAKITGMLSAQLSALHLREGPKYVSTSSVRLCQGRAFIIHSNSIAFQGFADLPLEVILLVGQLLAGQNSLATLVSLTATWRSLQQELTPVLYETVILLGDRNWWRMGVTSETIRAETTWQQRLNFTQTR